VKGFAIVLAVFLAAHNLVTRQWVLLGLNVFAIVGIGYLIVVEQQRGPGGWE
jgi:hypothetical protein